MVSGECILPVDGYVLWTFIVWLYSGLYKVSPGILHYQWSQDPSTLRDPLNKAMAGIVNVILWTSSAWYVKHGIKDNAFAVGLSAALQGAAVLKQIL